jgi:hypothetical protein
MLKTAQLVTGLIVIFIVTIGITVYSGLQTERWVPFSGLTDARKLLKELPKEINDWEVEGEDSELDKATVTMLQIQDGYLVRAYRNKSTQAVVYFLMMVGSTGRVVVHTPEICFGGKDYQKENTRSSVTIPVAAADGSGEADNTFWKVDFINQGLRHDRISFYYSISVGERWVATENPRYTFQFNRYAYKIQLQAFANDKGESVDNVKQFLQDCLPTIQEYLRPCN